MMNTQIKMIKIISGGQTGADIAALQFAKAMDIPTGGYIPKGFLTQNGPKPEYKDLYNLVEHPSDKYAPRTFANVKESDGTLRIAKNFDSPGEICTLKAINQYQKPYFDILVKDPQKYTTLPQQSPEQCAKWIKDNNIKVLNVAGNSEKTCNGIETFVIRYLTSLWEKL